MAIAAAPDAFESEFRHPEMINGFHHLLNVALQEATFARVVSIFQSSGWGKSRAICELHRQGVWVIYCTFTQGSGYPRRSPIADWFLDRANALISADTQGQLACMVFFLAYMEACLEELLLIAPSSNPRDFVRMLYKSGDSCEEGVQGLTFWLNVQKRVDALLHVYAEQGLDRSSEKTRQACWTEWELRAAKRVNGVVARLQKKLLQNAAVDEAVEVEDEVVEVEDAAAAVTVLFAFDEARILVPESLETNLFLPLRRATSAFNPSSGILALFSDTTSRLGNFDAPIWLDKSDRMPGSGLLLAPPIWAIFWADYGLDDYEEWTKLCAQYNIPAKYNVLSQYWAVKYGRPLWWGTFKAGLSYGAKAALDNVILLARDKLLGGHGGWAKYVRAIKPVSLTQTAALAVLGSRCALQFEPHCSLISELVASHLLTVVKVDASRECVWADFPMEPVVAGAASDIMRELDRQDRSTELYLPLSVALKAGWIHKGYKGELVSRLIMLRAFDKAVWGKGRRWCTVDEFVQALVGKSLMQMGREQEEKLEEAAKVEKSLFTQELQQVAQRRLCFQAFYNIGKKSYDVTAADLRMLAERRCAMVAEENTWGVDHFLVDVKGTVSVRQQAKAKQADDDLAALAKESPAFCGLPHTGAYLDLHMNVDNVGNGKVSLMDSKRVEAAVLEQSGKFKVLTAVLELQQIGGDETGRKWGRWEKQRSKHPRLFKAWQDWLAVPRRNQVILKVNGLAAFRPLFGDEAFNLLVAAMELGPLLSPCLDFELTQAASVQKMFLMKIIDE